MRLADGDYARTAVQWPAYSQYQEHSGSWLVRERAEVMMQMIERLSNATAKPDKHGTRPRQPQQPLCALQGDERALGLKLAGLAGIRRAPPRTGQHAGW
jgi:hypothetical protein